MRKTAPTTFPPPTFTESVLPPPITVKRSIELARKRFPGLQHAIQVTFPRGHVLVEEGESMRFAFFILDGRVTEEQNFFVPPDGNQTITLTIVSQQQIAGLQALVPGYCALPAYATIRALEAGEALCIPITAIDGRDAAVLRHMYETWLETCKRLIRKQVTMQVAHAINMLIDFIERHDPDAPVTPAGAVDYLCQLVELMPSLRHAAALEEELLHLRPRASYLESERDQLKRQLEELLPAYDSLKADLARIQAQSDAWKPYRNGLRQQLVVARQQSADHAAEIERLRAQVAALQADANARQESNSLSDKPFAPPVRTIQ